VIAAISTLRGLQQGGADSARIIAVIQGDGEVWVQAGLFKQSVHGWFISPIGLLTATVGIIPSHHQEQKRQQLGAIKT
jgi:hypothetical protein